MEKLALDCIADLKSELLNAKIEALASLTSAKSEASEEATRTALAAAEKAVDAALAAAEKAVNTAEVNSQRWRDQANEWRGAMSDRERDFLTRKEFYTMIGTAVVVVTLILAILSHKP